MIKGLKYAIFFFSIVPLLVFVVAQGDLTFLSEKNAFTKQYSLTFEVWYTIVLMISTMLMVVFVDKKIPQINADGVPESISRLRKKSFFVLFVTYSAYLSTTINFFYIDHSAHWIGRETMSFLPSTISFYLSPVNDLIIFLSLINISFMIANFHKNFIVASSRHWLRFFFILDLAFISMTAYNTGNRWYLALFAVLFFLASSLKIKKVLLFLAPVIFVFGGFFSTVLLALRVTQDPFLMLAQLMSQDNFGVIIKAVLLSSEGLNLGTLFELANISLFDSNFGYLVSKIVTFPFPGSMVEKLPPFNLLVASLIYGEGVDPNLSLNSTLFGIIIYSFGLLSIQLMPLFVYLIYRIDKYLSRKYNSMTRVLFFCLAFAGFRFNFEFFIVHLVYFLTIVRLMRRSLVLINPANRHMNFILRHRQGLRRFESPDFPWRRSWSFRRRSGGP